MRSFSVVTFGCQMNQHDSERVREVLLAADYTECAEPASADLVLLNTCSVREKAEHKLRSEVGRIAMIKRERPDLVIGVLGCLAEQEGERLLARMPDVDLVLGPDRIADLPRELAEVELGGLPRVATGFDVEAPHFLTADTALARSHVSAFVTVMKGCNERCSFCIVPTTRGPERYRPASEIVREIEALVAAGTREVTLLGQTVNSYTDPEGSLPEPPGANEVLWAHTSPSRARADESQFAALLRRIVERVPGLLRLRYTSPHPRHLTSSLIRAHAELEPLARHVHLPVQSGSDRVLRRMIRRYSAAEYRERVAALRRYVPGVTLSTDVIVGFPGETEQDLQATLELVREVRYSGLFGFMYSPRPYTPALRLGDDVSEEEKRRRLEALFAVADIERRANLERFVGREVSVLVEGPGRNDEFSGRSERNEIVHVESERVDPTGRVVRVRVERAFKNSLSGVLLDETGCPPRVRAEGKEGATRVQGEAPAQGAARPRALPVL